MSNFWNTIFILGFAAGLMAQPGILYEVNFDDGCMAQESITGEMGVLLGSPMCDCGVQGEALRFDGIDDELNYIENVDMFLNQEFAISFYVFIQNGTQSSQFVDLLTYSSSCERDSSLTFRYLPTINNIEVEMANNSIDRFEPIRAELSENLCWHYIVLNRFADRMELYINNVFAGETPINPAFLFKPNAPLSFGSSPCAGITNQRLNGLIDEFKIYDEPLTELEIDELDLHPQRIITRDTTIFLGESLQLNTGENCSAFFSWDPSISLDDPLDPNPVASPTETTIYQYAVENLVCLSVDQVRVSVIDESVLSCEDLVLPNVFTPNDDSKNDTYGISNNFLVDQLIYFEIFDKWGSRVFSTSNKETAWDGTFEGQMLNPGTLLFKVKYSCSGNEFTKSGSFILLR